MPDEFDVLEGITETLYPVLGNRWLVKSDGTKVLQQSFVTNTGKQLWKDVPAVEEVNDEGSHLE